MTTTARKGKRSQRQKEQALLERLPRVLSEEEIQRVLGGALAELDGEARKRLVARLGKETGAALQRVLEPTPGRKQPRPGTGKVRQEWERLWSEWNECVFDSGSEEGRYVIQEAHWEPPFFDGSSLAHDLESVAARMRGLLPRVLDENCDPDLSFREAIVRTDDEIGSGLPEWIDDPERCGFGPEVTNCLLEWEWRVGQRTGRSPFEIVDGICRLDGSLKRTGLDGDAIIRFVLDRGEADQRAILKGVSDHEQTEPWSGVLQQTHSGWFGLYQELARRWDAGRFLASCRANIAQDWELALPPLKEMLHRKAFTEAQSLIDDAVASLLHLPPSESWDPRQALLIQHPWQRYRTDGTTARVRLLKAWRRTAAGLGHEDVACALELQTELLTSWEDWDAALKAFHKAEESAGAAACSRLFVDWCAKVSEAAVGHPEGWVPGLAEAARLGDAAVFHRAVRAWLKQLESAPKDIERSLHSIEVLTIMLDESKLKRAAPALSRWIAARSQRKGTLVESMRRWVKRLRGEDLFGETLEFWKRNAVSLVPDPAQTRGSNYADCAEWMKVLLDLDRRAYERVLQDWSARHHRRRNLWQALKEKGLPARDQARA